MSVRFISDLIDTLSAAYTIEIDATAEMWAFFSEHRLLER